jgi:hypothetical protein
VVSFSDYADIYRARAVASRQASTYQHVGDLFHLLGEPFVRSDREAAIRATVFERRASDRELAEVTSRARV